jgi:tryptophan-rich sensory protein
MLWEVLLHSVGFRVYIFGTLAWKEKCLYKKTYPSTVLFLFLLFIYSPLFISSKEILGTHSTYILTFALILTLTFVLISIVALLSGLTIPSPLPVYLFSSHFAFILWFTLCLLNMHPLQLLLDTALQISHRSYH